MSNYTTYKALEKPLSTEKYDIAVANRNADVIDTELNKLEQKDLSLDEALAAESDRAKDAETKLTDALDAEVQRAQTAENANAEAIRTERMRSSNVEADLQSDLEDEINRAQAAEQLLDTGLNTVTESVNAVDSRVTALDEKVDGLSAEDIGAVTPEELNSRINARLITAQINGDDISSELTALGISNELTILEVFNKLPNCTTAVISSNSQQTAYSRSFPANEGAAQLIYRKVYGDRGTVLFLPIHGNRVWAGKFINGTVQWTELAKSTDLTSYLPLQGGTLTGPLKVQGTVTATAFTGNASSASKAASSEMLAGWEDTRNTATKPNDYNEKIRPVGIKQNTTTGIPDGGTYATLVGMRGWKDASGGKAHELGFTANGKLYHRVGDTDTWEPWRELAHKDDIAAASGSASATKLATARNIQTNLASTSPASFDGTQNVTPGVTGILPLTNGGTGATDAATARSKLGITPANIGAASYSEVTSGNFNDMTAPGVYTMRASGTTNQPVSGYNYWGLIVLRSDDNDEYVEQIAIREGTTDVYVRFLNNGDDEWSSWVRLARTTDTVAAATTAASATKAVQDGDGNNIASTYLRKTEGVLKDGIAMEYVGYKTVDAYSSTQYMEYPDEKANTKHNYIALLEGRSSNSSDFGNYDYGRLMFLTYNHDSATNFWAVFTLGSYFAGSTERFSFDKTSGHVRIKVPKGSDANCTLYRLKGDQ